MTRGIRPDVDDFDIALAALIRSVMARRDPALTVTDLARKTGLPRTTLSKLVNGRTSMAVWQLREIADGLSVNAASLIERATRIADGTEPDEFAPDARGDRAV